MRRSMMKSGLLLLSLSYTFIVSNSTYAREFGERGSRGQNGQNGAAGYSGQDRSIKATGQSETIDVSGAPGEDGYDGDYGRDARSCGQPHQPAYNLTGADGGDGGSGGYGGRGGSGGDVTVFYQNINHLKRIQILNQGAPGGRGGYGADGGEGCECYQTFWDIEYCGFRLLKKQKNVEGASWIYANRKETLQCGEYPNRVRPTETFTYRWEDQGVTQRKTFRCTSGDYGRTGSNGSNGSYGSQGSITLVPRLSIAPTKPSFYDGISNLLGKRIDLSKDIWVTRNGTAQLLAPSSNVPSYYKYLLKTSKLSYQINWNASQSPSQLGVQNVRIGGQILSRSETGELSLSLPGTIEYTKSQSGNLTTISLTGGFDPARLDKVSISDISGIQEDGELVLEDVGNLWNELKSVELEVSLLTNKTASGVTVSPRPVFRHKKTFSVVNGTAGIGAQLTGDSIALDAGRYFYPWLKSGYKAKYQILVKQITRNGTEYMSNIERSFTVGE
ncbi:MAG: hypothetical protein HRU19_28180 [Pseudobacteriovorax sp.]|nr:hypothetical protein [Pseudobacteriovorax sp.]